MSASNLNMLDTRTFLKSLGFVSDFAIDYFVDACGFATVEALLEYVVEGDINPTDTCMTTYDRRRLWERIQLERTRARMREDGCGEEGHIENTTPSPLKGIMVQLESKSSAVCDIIRTNIADINMTDEFAKNLVPLLTSPRVTNIHGMVLKGPPFKAVVVQDKNGRTTKAVVEVAEAVGKAPFLVVRILGHHKDGTVSEQLPVDFTHTTPYDSEKISISVKHIDHTSSSLSSLKAKVPDTCAALHLIQLQLLGGTNKALPKIPQAVAKMCIEAVKAKITLNEDDVLFKQAEEFMRALRKVNFDYNVHQGMLLWGPAGGAKTTFARTLASFGFVTAFDGNLISLGTKYQNSASTEMRNLFDFCAHYNHLPFLLVCDEIDCVVRKRETTSSSSKKGGGNESENTLSLFLEQLTSKKNVFVIGTTNKYHSIDPAAIRPGRMGLHGFVGRLSPRAHSNSLLHL